MYTEYTHKQQQGLNNMALSLSSSELSTVEYALRNLASEVEVEAGFEGEARAAFLAEIEGIIGKVKEG